jgi:hypothetical protein
MIDAEHLALLEAACDINADNSLDVCELYNCVTE